MIRYMMKVFFLVAVLLLSAEIMQDESSIENPVNASIEPPVIVHQETGTRGTFLHESQEIVQVTEVDELFFYAYNRGIIFRIKNEDYPFAEEGEYYELIYTSKRETEDGYFECDISSIIHIQSISLDTLISG